MTELHLADVARGSLLLTRLVDYTHSASEGHDEDWPNCRHLIAWTRALRRYAIRKYLAHKCDRPASAGPFLLRTAHGDQPGARLHNAENGSSMLIRAESLSSLPVSSSFSPGLRRQRSTPEYLGDWITSWRWRMRRAL
jgi:hypothetical protein